jgi:hypothetical protein
MVMKWTADYDPRELVESLNGLVLDQAGRGMLFALEALGIQTIAFLRSLTNEMRPPVRAGEGARHAHPGHWSDITGILANSYGWSLFSRQVKVRFSTDADSGKVSPLVKVASAGLSPISPAPPYTLFLMNTADYAAALESKEGYWVLSGVTESGDVERMLRDAIRALPGKWVIF